MWKDNRQSKRSRPKKVINAAEFNKKERLEEEILMGNKSVAPADPNTSYNYVTTDYPYIPFPVNSFPPAFSEHPNTAAPPLEEPTRSIIFDTHSEVVSDTGEISTANTLVNQPVSSLTTNLHTLAPHETSTTHFVSPTRPTPVFVTDWTPARVPSTLPTVNLPVEQRSPSLVINADTVATSKRPSTPLIRHISVYVLDSLATHTSINASVPAASSAATTDFTSKRPLVSTESPAPVTVANASLPDSVTNFHSSAFRRSTPIVSTSPANISNTKIPEKLPSPTSSVDSVWIKPSNTSPPFSPDTSVVSPTLDLPPTPSPSPQLTKTLAPTKSTTPFEKIQSPPLPASSKPWTMSTASPPKLTASQVQIHSPSPSIPAKSSVPSKIMPKRAASKISVSTSTDTPEAIAKERHDGFTQTGLRTQSVGTSPVAPPTETTASPKEKSFVLSIVAVPSFALRSTAVATFPSEDPGLVEKTEITHKDISIFKYHLTQKDIDQSIGNHSKATMFKMDTRLKQTPIPTPSLLFLTKNFNDGSYEPDDSSVATATFSSLGLDNDLGIESVAPSSTETRFNDGNPQKNMPKSSSPHDTTTRQNLPSLPSILKKPGVRAMISTQTHTELLGNLQQNKPGHPPSTVVFNISPVTKATESISRSERLFTKR